MNANPIRRRRAMSFKMIACPSTDAKRRRGNRWLPSISPMDGSCRPCGGQCDHRSDPGGNGKVVQTNVAAVRVDGRHVAAIVATVVGYAMGMAGPVEVGIQSGLGGVCVLTQSGSNKLLVKEIG